MEPIIGDLPDHIKKVRESKLHEKRDKQVSDSKDKELLLKSTNPEIQAICRLLGWKK